MTPCVQIRCIDAAAIYFVQIYRGIFHRDSTAGRDPDALHARVKKDDWVHVKNSRGKH